MTWPLGPLGPHLGHLGPCEVLPPRETFPSFYHCRLGPLLGPAAPPRETFPSFYHCQGDRYTHVYIWGGLPRRSCPSIGLHIYIYLSLSLSLPLHIPLWPRSHRSTNAKKRITPKCHNKKAGGRRCSPLGEAIQRARRRREICRVKQSLI